MNTIAIGFANKFYTLWNITEETKSLGNGCNYVVTHYTYIKNISFDKETVGSTLHAKTQTFAPGGGVVYREKKMCHFRECVFREDKCKHFFAFVRSV